MDTKTEGNPKPAYAPGSYERLDSTMVGEGGPDTELARKAAEERAELQRQRDERSRTASSRK